MLSNGTSAARRLKVGSSGAPTPKIGSGASKLSAAAARSPQGSTTGLLVHLLAHRLTCVPIKLPPRYICAT